MLNDMRKPSGSKQIKKNKSKGSFVQDFKIMSVEALRIFLSLRKKPYEGDYEALVYR